VLQDFGGKNHFCEIKSRIAMAKAAFNKQQIGLKFEEETSEMQHLECGFVWC
jgi:hypothetical protein